MFTCSVCGRENPESARYCTFCGAPQPELVDTDRPTPSNLIQIPQDGSLRELRAALVHLNDRISQIEHSIGLTGLPSSAPVPHQYESAEPQESVPGLSSSGPLGKFIARFNWRLFLWGNWLAIAGITAVVVGVGFSLRLAFENAWIDELGRILLGVVGGTSFLLAGHYWIRNYPYWAQVMIGGGIALLYLSIFSASNLYAFISTVPAFMFMGLVTVTAATLAVRHYSVPIAIIGILGGLVTPVLLWETSVDPFMMLMHLLILDIGVVGVAALRNWRWLMLLSLIGSGGLLVLSVFTLTPSFSLSMIGVTSIFVVFFGSTILFHVIRGGYVSWSDYLVMAVNASFYYFLSCWLFWDDYSSWVGGFSLILGLLYGLAGYIGIVNNRPHVTVGLFLLGISLFFVTFAIPIQFIQNGPLVVVAWATEGTILMWLSLRLNMIPLRLASLIVFSAMAICLSIIVINFGDSAQISPRINWHTPIFNERVASFAAGILGTSLSACWLWRYQSYLVGRERSLFPVFIVGTNLLILWVMSAEVIGFIANAEFPSPNELHNAQNLSLTILWALYGSLIFAIGVLRRWHWVRLGGLFLLAISVMKLFVYDSFALEQGYRVIAFLSLGGILIAGGYLFQRYRSVIHEFLFE